MVEYKETVFSKSPEELYAYMQDTFHVVIPKAIETVDDLSKAGKLLGRYASYYSFLTQLSSLAKMRKRLIKKSGTKEEYEMAMMQEDIINAFMESSKIAYNSISRMITVKQEVNNELKMTDGKVFHP